MNYSVLMSVYHKEQPENLRTSINSLLKQTVMPAQIVIVCDGELTQGLYEVLHTFEKENPSLFQVVQLA